jgi:hypothetical protein
MIGAHDHVKGGMRATTTRGRKFAPDYRSIVEGANRYLESRGLPLLQQNSRNPDGAMR